MTNSIETVGFLFDLDGVLIDSERKYSEIWGDINREFPTGDPDMPKKIKGTTLEHILSTYYTDPKIRARVEERLNEREQKMIYEYTPGARELLVWLKDNGIPTALFTSSNQLKMKHLDDELPEMRSFFTQIVTGEMVSRSKPAPDGYLYAAKLIGAAPEHCVVFEDSLQGVKAGRAAGGLVVGVAGTLPAEKIAPYSDIVVHSLTDIDPKKIIDILKVR